MLIEICTKPNVNGNRKRIQIEMQENGVVTALTDGETFGRASRPVQTFQVTPREFKNWAELMKRRNEKG